MAEAVVYVHLLETRTGEWCPTCLLPSAITVVSTISDNPTMVRPGGPTMTKCADCEWEPTRTDGHQDG